ncbi:tetratricopeptide repeat protein [Niastella caeni]|uniref:histidine kinase n=1 Tax=Niastella caeni TaxID=2569763 RepID=A0A4S8HXR2_9BACT|nr:tetratricopeptide repeat-containing sensor histidine kinase [Niastella caeni]THU39589.1 tetratricopeptide repeat protein [Niastella caeni]
MLAHRSIICGISIILFHVCQAQPVSVYTDSIRTCLQLPRPDTGKYYLLLRLAQLPECPADTLLAYGHYWYNYTEKRHISPGRPEALYAIGLALYRKGMNPEAAERLYQAATVWERNGRNPLQLARTYELIAGIHKIMQRYADALAYYRLACRIKKTLNNEAILLSTYNGLGNTFRLLHQTDSAVHYLEKAHALTAGNELAKAQVSNNLGNIYWSLKNWLAARQWYQKALQSFETLQQPEGIAEACFNLGAIATQLQQYHAAIAYYNKSLEAVPTGQPVEHLEWIYEHLADAYFHTGNFENAYTNERAYDKIKDSLLSLQVQQSIAALKEKYETEKKEHALALEKERTARLLAANSQQFRFLCMLAGVALLITVMGFIMIRNIRRKQLLAAALAGLKEKEKQQLIQEQALKSNIAMLEGREAERQRIARDLHDRLGSTLSSVRLFMQSNQTGTPPGNSKIMLLLEEAVNDVRRISHDLSDNVLIKYGLEEALKDLKDTIESTGRLQVTLYQQAVDGLPADTASEIYYIVRELAANAVKHSDASRLFIQLLQDNRLLHLTVEDNGSGFNPAVTHKGIGLHNIEIRARKIGAQYTIDARTGKGSCFCFAIPLP